MKEILDSVSNPYNEENFERLFNLFLNSEGDNEFYTSCVKYYQDRIDTGNLQSPQFKTNFMKIESLSGWIVQRYFSEFFPTEHRLYINAPLNHIGTIVDKFISECDSKHLPFELKYPTAHIERNDTIVIGSCTEAYEKHIEILRQIAEEHPDIVKDCGTPPLLTGVLDGWIGLADENIENRYISYTQSRLSIFKKSINRYLCSHLDIASQIEADGILETSKSIEKVMDTIEEEGLEGDEREFELECIDIYLENVTLTLESKKKLEDYISRNPQVLKDIHKGFLEECERSKVDSQNPIFYEGSQNQILENQKSKRVDITDGLRDKISATTATGVANMYLESEYKGYLSIGSQVEIIKSIFEKELTDRKNAEVVYEDLAFLGEIGLINTNSAESLYHEESHDCLKNFLQEQFKVSDNFEYTRKPLKQLLKNQDENLSSDEIKQIIEDRKKFIIDYLTAPQLPIAQKQQRIQHDKKIGESLLKDRYFPFNVKMLLEYQIDLLDDDVEHNDERLEASRKIAEELNSKTKDDIDVDKILEKVRHSMRKLKEWDLDDW